MGGFVIPDINLYVENEHESYELHEWMDLGSLRSKLYRRTL